VTASGRSGDRFAVQIEDDVWRDEVERYNERSSARVAAERERRALAQDGIAPRFVAKCLAEGSDRTDLRGLLKVYVPIREAPASQRPFGFVFRPGKSEGRLELVLLAFGERHPRRGTRSVYERAHKRLHGRYPDQ
jgi:hypothetical protein